MNRREADAEAWERGEHPRQTRGHSPSRDPQIAECGYCRAHLTVPEDEPVCTSCGDRPLGCPRCTDRDGDTR